MLIIDRLEEGIAVCEPENGPMVELPLAKLPQGVREGDVLIPNGEGYRIDLEETRRRRAEHAALFTRLSRKKP